MPEPVARQGISLRCPEETPSRLIDQSMEVGHTQQNENFWKFWVVLLLYSEHRGGHFWLHLFLGLLCAE